MSKKAFFFIDDVIWMFRDLTRQRPASIFEHHFLKSLKEIHDKTGLKVQMNLFFRTDYFYGNDEFSLADMTDAYKAEFEANSDWLKFAFHAKEEFPDYPVPHDGARGYPLRRRKKLGEGSAVHPLAAAEQGRLQGAEGLRRRDGLLHLR